MSSQGGNGLDVLAAEQHGGYRGMAEIVRPNSASETGFEFCASESSLDAFHGPAFIVDDRIGSMAIFSPPLLQ